MEDNIYQLSCFQASELSQGRAIKLIFNLPDTAVDGASMQGTKFNFKRSEPSYPVHEHPDDVPAQASPAAQKASYYAHRVELTQYARFWHYLGDATHRSELVPTPHMWHPGLRIDVENKYNYPEFSALVKDISLAQTPDQSWVWVVTLEPY